MSSNIQLKRRIGGAVGAPTALEEGELAYNDQGFHANDALHGGALFVGDGVNVKALVSAARQVEILGDQDIDDQKNFLGTLNVGTLVGINDYSFPNTRGAAGQVLALNVGADALEFTTPGSVALRDSPIPDLAQGTIEGDFNTVPDWSAVGGDQIGTDFVVADGEMWVLNWDGGAYMWGGGTGTFGLNGTPAVAGDFVPLGSATSFASAPEVQIGTVTDKAIAPDVAATELFRVDNASGPQNVDVQTTFLRGTSFAGPAETGFYAGQTIGCYGGVTLTGQDLAAEALTIDNAIIDGGTF